MINPKVISLIVKNDLCIGCGACVSVCPNKSLETGLNQHKFIVPKLTSNPCDSKGNCLKVCPTEKEVFNTSKYDTKESGSNIDALIGNYFGIYAGYSKTYRASSSSGGIATYVLDKAMEKGLIDAVIVVAKGNNNFYQYKIISERKNLVESSKTKYLPVTLSEIFEFIKNDNRRFGISAVACFLKAIKLTETYTPNLSSKVLIKVGIICGGLKSGFFTDYLAQKAELKIQNFENPNYRDKTNSKNALDYSFTAKDKLSGSLKSVKMRELGDMWGTGMFKSLACDFCQDVTANLADISVGDAWIKPYLSDPNGTSIFITRSKICESLVQEGVSCSELKADELSRKQFVSSQSGSFSHRHSNALIRKSIYEVIYKKSNLPDLRISLKSYNPINIFIQLLRIQTRKNSLEFWKITDGDVMEFDKKIKFSLAFLRLVTKIKHAFRLLHKKLRK